MIKEKNILIIDDEEVILNAIKKVVIYEGFTCDTSFSVSESLEKIQETRYGLIICDIMMPKIDGFEFLNILKKRKLSTPVVITTGFSTLENAVKALYEGAIGFIPKPFSVEELTSMIKRGIIYGKIYNEKRTCYLHEKKISLDFIPCPPKYYRLGFDSWVMKKNEKFANIGLTDLFLKSIGMVKEIEFMNTDEAVYQGGNCIKIIDNEDYCHQLLAPISGKIIDINEKIIINKSLLEKDPYFNGWIYKIIATDLDNELNNLTPCSSDI